MTDGSGIGAGPYVVIIVMGLVFLTLGVLHYAGYARRVVHPSIFSPYALAGAAWLGAAMVLAGMAGLLGEASDSTAVAVLRVLLHLAALVAFVVGLVSLVWMPRRLRPGWLDAWVQRGRPDAEAVAWPAWRRGPR